MQLTNFKNYADAALPLHPKFNCFSGLNGAGKTNLLEAVYLLCMTRTWHRMRDDDLIRDDEGFYRVEGVFHRQSEPPEEVVVKYPREGRKAVEVKGEKRKRMSDHIGQFPVVMIAPGEEQLLLSLSAERRRWMDQSLSQMDRQYLEALMSYNRLLRQRNACLKADMASGRKKELIRVYSQKMLQPARYVQESRSAFIQKIEARFGYYYTMLSDGRELPSLEYEPRVAENTHETQWELDETRDIASGRTTSGIHKDDLAIGLDGSDSRTYASQGQRKSILLALRCAQYEWLHKQLENSPILLLDDIFDKLDPERVLQLIRLIDADPFGQVLITDTEPRRIERIFEKEEIEFSHFLVEEGRVKEI